MASIFKEQLLCLDISKKTGLRRALKGAGTLVTADDGLQSYLCASSCLLLEAIFENRVDGAGLNFNIVHIPTFGGVETVTTQAEAEAYGFTGVFI